MKRQRATKARPTHKRIIREIVKLVTGYVERLRPPPANPKLMISELVVHQLAVYRQTMIQVAEGERRGYCRIEEHAELVEADQDGFNNIIAHHHPDYKGDPRPLTPARARQLQKDIPKRLIEILGEKFPVPSDDARLDLSAEIRRFTGELLKRYSAQPFGKIAIIKERAVLQKLVLQWAFKWRVRVSPENIAFHVQQAFKEYTDLMTDPIGPLPPPSEAMQPMEAVHHLESLIRRLHELGDGENSEGDPMDETASPAAESRNERTDAEVDALLSKLRINGNEYKTHNYPEFVNRHIDSQRLRKALQLKEIVASRDKGKNGANQYLVRSVARRFFADFNR